MPILNKVDTISPHKPIVYSIQHIILASVQFRSESEVSGPSSILSSGPHHHPAGMLRRRTRHISIGDSPSASSSSLPKGYVRVKNQWQKAVRRISGSSSGGTAGTQSPECGSLSSSLGT